MAKGNKLVNIMIILMLSIVLVAVVGFVVFKFMTAPKEKTEPKAKELVELTVDTEEITTNLADDSYVKIKFKLQTDNKDAKKELEQRSFQVNDIIINKLSTMTSEEVRSQEGMLKAEEEIQNKVNELMQEGKVTNIYTTMKVIS
ncbi:flagellar basal body-associated protein FliL [Massilibacterium senegalense]|uniref:flagellar basal body-associated protein FliL n=1 Tax=Massilibacterium senegalense TaxID=1632858 RepID=UPI000784F844|nr:flagellar basal body-associated protein FliL [Massilibacterium senegalense]